MGKAIDKLPPWARRGKLWASAFVALAGVWVVAPQVGIDLPRPAFISELRAVESKVNNIEIELAGALSEFKKANEDATARTSKHLYRLELRGAQTDLRRQKLRLKRVNAQVEEAEGDGKPVRSLRRDEVDIETEIERLQREVKRLEVQAR